MRTKRRGFVFYLFLALLGLGPVAYCVVRFWGGWRLIDGGAAIIITLFRRKRPYFLRITEGLTEADIDDILTSDDLDDEPDARDGSIFDTFDPTKDYYGKHGEFDKNDDSWGTSEYIRQFRNNDPDVDLSEHFDWQERAEAESDGFLEDD